MARIFKPNETLPRRRFQVLEVSLSHRGRQKMIITTLKKVDWNEKFWDSYEEVNFIEAMLKKLQNPVQKSEWEIDHVDPGVNWRTKRQSQKFYRRNRVKLFGGESSHPSIQDHELAIGCVGRGPLIGEGGNSGLRS